MGKGRDKERISYRNAKLAARFYFYSNLQNLQYETCLLYLCQEFDLSSSRIDFLLMRLAPQISLLDRKQITILQLQAAFPYFSWKYDHSMRLKIARQPVLIPS